MDSITSQQLGQQDPGTSMQSTDESEPVPDKPNKIATKFTQDLVARLSEVGNGKEGIRDQPSSSNDGMSEVGNGKEGIHDQPSSSNDGISPSQVGNAKHSLKGMRDQSNSTNDGDDDDDGNWDCAVETPPKTTTDQWVKCWRYLAKAAVIICAVLLFFVVIGAGCISRIIVHFMIWKLNPPHQNNTNSFLNKLGGNLKSINERTVLYKNCTNLNRTSCAAKAFERQGLPSSWQCLQLGNDTCSIMEETPSVNVGWIWGLLIVINIPFLFTFITSSMRFCFKKAEEFESKVFIISLTVELIHATGLCMLVFIVLPEFDPVSSTVLSYCVYIIPAILSVRNPVSNTYIRKQLQIRHENGTQIQVEAAPPDKQISVEANETTICVPGRVKNIFGLVFLTTSIGFVCAYIYISTEDTVNFVKVFILLLISLLMVSIIWWENYVLSNVNKINSVSPSSTSEKSFITDYVNSKREKVTVMTSFAKMIWTFLATLIIYVSRSTGSTSTTVRTFLYWDESAEIFTLSGKVKLDSRSYVTYGCIKDTPYLMAITCFLLTFVCFKASRYACRVVLQRWAYTLPLWLVLIFTPFLSLLLMSFPLQFTFQSCNAFQPLWEVDWTLSEATIRRVWTLIVAAVCGMISLLIVTFHVWQSNGSKMEKVERLFVKPAYCGIFIDLSLLLTRRRIANEDAQDIQSNTKENITETPEYNPLVYFCATMWHETENEMTQLLKSIFRVDLDQYQLYTEQKRKQEKDPTYFDDSLYEFEVHIFFDDAFKPRNGKKGRHVNDYVVTLENCISATANDVYFGSSLGEAKKYATPYGAKYVWQLLSKGSELVVHLKDKTRIRHKKRWSQIMYMNYLLLYQLDNSRSKSRNKARESETIKSEEEVEKEVTEDIKNMARNTFILALDGDVDFRPEAVKLLLDRMKKDPLVGAACGRIHPIGTGPMVWYQKFEYAVSHWLQKATEHVFGCVLCSPGCFSLFRGSALIDDNVVKTYTKLPTEAVHYVQYDQGEDRWLCTLLLKQGYRIEYCAASDAMTFAPEGFFEFYKQRRRWAPSTMANILDLLLDSNNVTSKNQNISKLFIIYQIFLFVSSILTPGTIFLLILGAAIAAFPEIEPWVALILNLIPVFVFMISIFTVKEDTQLIIAGIVSTLYSLVMLVVFIGLLKEGIESQFCSITTVFFCFVAGIFVISAILHPQEFTCLLHGFLYFLAVPSMSMLMFIYSVGNLHVVTWGTREKAVESSKVDTKTRSKVEGQSCSIGNWCRCILCYNETTIDVENQNKETQENGESGSALAVSSLPNVPRQKTLTEATDTATTQQRASTQPQQNQVLQDTNNQNSPTKENETVMEQERKQKKLHGIFKECIEMPKKEEKFWNRNIKKYLKPLDPNIEKEKQPQIQQELRDLRNKVFFFFFIVNALLVTIVYSLTHVNAYQGTLSIPLPCHTMGKQGNIEPISIAFTLIFGILLFIQFFGMMFHRVSTITHIIASRELFEFKSNVKPPPKLSGAEEEEGVEQKLGHPGKSLIAKKRWTLLKASMALRTLASCKKGDKQTMDQLRRKLATITEESRKDEEDDKLAGNLNFSNMRIPKMSIRSMRSIDSENTDVKQGPSQE